MNSVFIVCPRNPAFEIEVIYDNKQEADKHAKLLGSDYDVEEWAVENKCNLIEGEKP